MFSRVVSDVEGVVGERSEKVVDDEVNEVDGVSAMDSVLAAVVGDVNRDDDVGVVVGMAE